VALYLFLAGIVVIMIPLLLARGRGRAADGRPLAGA
jgi:hypothetical protein